MARQHTSPPWQVSPGLIIDTSENALRIATIDSDFPDDVNEANADFIIKAVNAHDEMVKLIEDIQDHTQYMMENYGYDRGWYDADSDLEKRVDAVLKKVKL